MRRRHLFLLLISGFVALLLAGTLLLITLGRGSTSYAYSLNYTPKSALLLLIGPQSVCPPFVQCPQVQIKPQAISLWLIETHEETTSPIWQTYAKVSNRQLLYVKLP